MYSSIKVRNLFLLLHLGVSKEERQTKQRIKIDLEVFPHDLPVACHSDKVQDTYCYDKLIYEIHNFCESKEFCLIEHMLYLLYEMLKTKLPNADINLSVEKWPKIHNFTGSACFCITEKYK